MKKRKSLSAVFKHIFDEIEILLTMFLSKAIQVGRLMTEEELLHLIEPLLVYMEHGNSAFTEEKLIAQASGLQKKEVNVMNILERREQKGMAIGLKEGIEKTARKLLTMGFDIETVAEGTGLSLERVKEMKAELNREAK